MTMMTMMVVMIIMVVMMLINDIKDGSGSAHPSGNISITGYRVHQVQRYSPVLDEGVHLGLYCVIYTIRFINGRHSPVTIK